MRRPRRPTRRAHDPRARRAARPGSCAAPLQLGAVVACVRLCDGDARGARLSSAAHREAAAQTPADARSRVGLVQRVGGPSLRRAAWHELRPAEERASKAIGGLTTSPQQVSYATRPAPPVLAKPPESSLDHVANAAAAELAETAHLSSRALAPAANLTAVWREAAVDSQPSRGGAQARGVRKAVAAVGDPWSAAVSRIEIKCLLRKLRAPS